MEVVFDDPTMGAVWTFPSSGPDYMVYFGIAEYESDVYTMDLVEQG